VEVGEYLDFKGWEVKRREMIREKRNLILDCPLCGAVTDKEHRRFYIVEETGVWVSNCCGEGGNLYTLRKQLGDLKAFEPSVMVKGKPKPPEALRDNQHFIETWHKNLLMDEVACDWLVKARGIPLEAAARFRLGLRMRNGERWLVVPYFSDGDAVLLKYRSMEGRKRFERQAGCPSPLYNLDSLDDEYERVYVTEGELDAVSMEAMGFTPAVSLPAGAGLITGEHAEALERFNSIYVVTDQDRQGNEAADKIAKRLGSFRCMRVKLPLKDANDCLAAGMESEVSEAVERAKSMGSGLVMSLGDVLRDALDSKALDVGTSTGLRDLDNVIGGIRRSEWTVVSGPTGAGKSTFMITLASNLAKAGESVLFGCFELSPEATAIRWSSQVLGKSIHAMDGGEKAEAVKSLEQYRDRCLVIPRHGRVPMQEIKGMVEYCCRRFGTTVVVLDHLDFLVDDINDHKAIDKAILEFSDLCAKFNVHGLLGCHPRSVETDAKAGRARNVTMNDLRGSSKIKQLAHNIMILNAVDVSTGVSVLRVEKKRWEGRQAALPARVPVRFDPNSLGYVNSLQVKMPKKKEPEQAKQVDWRALIAQN